MTDLAAAVAERLHGRTVACAESCTAGRVSAAFAAVGAASDWLRGGLVAYQEDVKRGLLDVTAVSVVTADAAAEMARGAAALLAADVAVATTGVLGDEPEEGAAPGTVYIATLIGEDLYVGAHHFAGDAETRCLQAVDAALEQLVTHLDRADHDTTNHDVSDAARTANDPSRSSTS